MAAQQQDDAAAFAAYKEQLGRVVVEVQRQQLGYEQGWQAVRERMTTWAQAVQHLVDDLHPVYAHTHQHERGQRQER